MLLIVSVLVFILLIFFIVQGKFLPGNILLVIPFIAALILGTGLTDTMVAMHKGVMQIMVYVALFVGAITYFGIMVDAGLFDPLINFLMKHVKHSTFSVMVITALLILVCQFDTEGITGAVVVIPAMLPIYDRMGIKRTKLLLAMGTMTGVMNIVPWSKPLNFAAAAAGVDTITLLYKLLPATAVGFVSCFVIYYLDAKLFNKNKAVVVGEVAGAEGGGNIQLSGLQLSDEERALRNPKMAIPNLIITILVIAFLLLGMPPYLVFFFGLAIVLPLNYKSRKAQNKRIEARGEAIVMPVYTMICAGAMLGIMNQTGMFASMADGLLNIIPSGIPGPLFVIITALLMTPLNFVLPAEVTMTTILPVMIQVGTKYGVDPVTLAGVFTVGHNIVMPMGLTFAGVYFALGMAGVEYGQSFKANAVWLIILRTLLVIFCALTVI